MPDLPFVDVFVGLGCNLDDCPAQMNEALTRFEPYGTDIRFQAVSETYRTEPQGRKNQPWFLNQVAHFKVDPVIWSPEGFFSILLAIEGQMGRVRTEERFVPRTIDLDLLLFGDVRTDSEMLTLPHPRMLERAFVLVPLADLAPDLALPGTDLTVQQALDRIEHTVKDTTIWQD